MKRVFLATNILLDVIEERFPFVVASANVLDLGISGHCQMFASPLTFANCVNKPFLLYNHELHK